ncbi:unnamed protein product [Mycena citricolor]|uniref:RecF/RecN/SMC N-terminal domain-containing protein n=1 Tax=Mycena citricolor TaxID=2018698 RepID=A0AAD2HXN9_9AGAR|nr:unnamed protein product [Mycena citricolor]
MDGALLNPFQGHNGSGKSAVLTGITVALGGKANATGRGNGLKSFIREGQNAADVTISIKNRGDEAYKHDVYGDSIVINRHFTKEGSSSWKIRSKSGQIISTKKDELAAICDHMNIQVDNPMNVLTQDAARQFLSASSATDKYKFFLKGTQLSQLSEEYETCMANISTTAKVLAQKKEALPDLEQALKEANARFEEADWARQQAQRVDELKKELAWAHVNVKEKEVEDKTVEVTRLGRGPAKAQEKIDEAEANLLVATDRLVTSEREHDALPSADDLQAKLATARANVKEKTTNATEMAREMENIANQIGGLNTQVKEYQENIDAEKARIAANNEGKRKDYERRLEAARKDHKQAQEIMRSWEQQKVAAEEEKRKLDNEAHASQSLLDDLHSQVRDCESAIENSKRAEKNQFAAYGNHIQEVIQAIKRSRWHGEVPLGPLGIYVRLKDSRWTDLLQTQLGKTLSSFAVTDGRDVAPLKKILMDSGNPKVTIHSFQPDLFDFSRGEPAPHILTVHRVLEVSDPHVLRLLVNLASIESRVLAWKRSEARPLLRSGQTAWTGDGYIVNLFHGGESSVPIQFSRGNGLMFAGSAGGEQHRQAEVKADLLQQIAAAKVDQQGLRSRWTVAREKIDECERKAHDAYQRSDRFQRAINELKGLLEDTQPASITEFENAIEEALKEKKGYEEQLQAVDTARLEADQERKRALTERDHILNKLNACESNKHAAQDRCTKAAEDQTKYRNHIDHWKRKHAEEQVKVDKAQNQLAALEKEFEEWTQGAEEFCERIETTRRPADLDRILKATQEALRDREKRIGASVETMADEVNKAKERFDRAKEDLKQMHVLNKALKRSLAIRLDRWHEFRRHIATRCKVVFGYHLSQRGYFGKVLFDHEDQTLLLKVQTDDQAATQGASRDKDPRSLSGGEKSFSTICLLLSLWESIGCPIRCLDEFDVFMDAVNRRISMKMMIDTANSSDKKQYVLITPQDISNMKPSSSVRVNRMSDPERGQGILQFAG